MMSSRSDRRGHWPRGKRRHEDAGDWTAVQLQLQTLFDSVSTVLLSRRQTARDIGVSDRTLRKWLDGTSRPPREKQDAVLAWLTRTRRQLGLTNLPLSPAEAKHLHPSSLIPRASEKCPVTNQEGLP